MLDSTRCETIRSYLASARDGGPSMLSTRLRELARDEDYDVRTAWELAADAIDSMFATAQRAAYGSKRKATKGSAT